MFSIKQHVRRHAAVVAVGAAVLGLTAASQADIYWNPDQEDGFTGNFNNIDPNFDDGIVADSDSDVVFNGSYDVTVDGDPTSVKTLAVTGNSNKFTGSGNLTANSFSITGNSNKFTGSGDITTKAISMNGESNTFSGSGTIYLKGSNDLSITNTGNNSIVSDIKIIPTAGWNGQESGLTPLKVNDGVLTINNFTMSQYGTLRKLGNGILKIDGTLDTTANNANYSYMAHTFDVAEGTVILSGTNYVGGAAKVAPDATLSGNAVAWVSINSIFDIFGHIAPGDNPIDTDAFISRFGKSGTFTIHAGEWGGGNKVNLHPGSCLDLDLISAEPGEYDVLQIIHDSGPSTTLNIYSGTQICINDMSDDGGLVGAYHIITGSNYVIKFNDNTEPLVVGEYYNFFNVLGLDSAYDYKFQLTSTGIDLIIDPATPIPEPASLGLLGLGAGLLMLRRKR